MKGSALVFCLLFALTLRVEAQWPRFRGPDGNGTAAAAALPLKWSEAEHVRWKTAVHGRGWSSFAVRGSHFAARDSRLID
jgi:hypothetical protein